jgi:hypothetical protein
MIIVCKSVCKNDTQQEKCCPTSDTTACCD